MNNACAYTMHTVFVQFQMGVIVTDLVTFITCHLSVDDVETMLHCLAILECLGRHEPSVLTVGFWAFNRFIFFMTAVLCKLITIIFSV